MNYTKKIAVALIMFAAASLQSGCGEGGGEGGEGGGGAAFTLTASTLSSQADASAHTHTARIPFSDISASPAADIFQYRSASNNGHSHVIALSRDQMMDLNNGMRLTLVSSTPDSGASHTHTWSVQGGSVLYEKNCFNCHGNANRGRSPMNVSFNASQTIAVINPSGAPASKSPAANPDPNYQPATGVPLDGAALYTANCTGTLCHGPLANSSKSNRTFSQIKGAISSNTGGMAAIKFLTDAQLRAIATALVK